MDRIRRVNEVVKRELGDLFERMICSDMDALITITAVNTTADLRSAHVHVSVFGSDEQKYSAMALIHRNRKVMQSLLSRHVKLKYTPKLYFELDDTPERADRIMRLLDDLKQEDEKTNDQ
jgi:ribosome-binding factor A